MGVVADLVKTPVFISRECGILHLATKILRVTKSFRERKGENYGQENVKFRA